MILIDERELNNFDGKLIHKKLSSPPTTRLEHGDYLLRGNGITAITERVTNSGLLADIESGRMVEKLQGCAENADIVLLLIEGLILPARDNLTLLQEKGDYGFSYWDNGKNAFTQGGAEVRLKFRRVNWCFHSVAEFLTSISLRWVHKVEFTLSASETAERLKELDAYFTKGFAQHLLHLTRSRPFTMKREDDIGEYILSGLPGLGTERSRLLLNIFNSPLAVFNATEKQLASVPGIGKITAHKIYEAVRGNYS